jgi:hypothetical protein
MNHLEDVCKKEKRDRRLGSQKLSTPLSEESLGHYQEEIFYNLRCHTWVPTTTAR